MTITIEDQTIQTLLVAHDNINANQIVAKLDIPQAFIERRWIAEVHESSGGWTLEFALLCFVVEECVVEIVVRTAEHDGRRNAQIVQTIGIVNAVFGQSNVVIGIRSTVDGLASTSATKRCFGVVAVTTRTLIDPR